MKFKSPLIIIPQIKSIRLKIVYIETEQVIITVFMFYLHFDFIRGLRYDFK